MDFKSASRCYFMDLGVANYYLKRTGTDERALNGTLNENYVFINLKERRISRRRLLLKRLLLQHIKAVK